MLQDRKRKAASSLLNSKTSITDYRLAIKPQESNRFTPTANSLPASGSGVWERESGGIKVEDSTDSVMTAPETQMFPPSGIWERQVEIRGRPSNESQQQLGKAAGKLYDLAAGMQALTSAEPKIKQPKSPALAPAALESSSASRGGLVSPQPSPGSRFNYSPNIYALERSERAKSAVKEYQVALLPPNVLMGIPMIRLGSSEAQANRALKALGQARKANIGQWTVWTYPQVGTNTTALQLYMRHGQVEALRIFDQSLVSADLGINLGSPLSAVKQRFGEPAFIVPEPAVGLGQNYIYPISQVGFLLSRGSEPAAPQVVSLLIFNVK